MKKLLVLTGFMVSTIAFAGNQANTQNDAVYKSQIKCGEEGCSIVCHESGNRWDTFLQTSGNIEVTHFLINGTRQLKAEVSPGQYTILDTNPNHQSCRITGVAA